MYMRQVCLQSRNVYTVAWIDESGAKLGKLLNLKDSDDPEEQWRVISVGDTRRLSVEAYERERDFKNQRKASDIKRKSHDQWGS